MLAEPVLGRERAARLEHAALNLAHAKDVGPLLEDLLASV
jgi:hypothetical protein